MMVGFPLHCFPIILFSWHLDLIVSAPPETKLPYKDIRENWVQSLSRGEGKSGYSMAESTNGEEMLEHEMNTRAARCDGGVN